MKKAARMNDNLQYTKADIINSLAKANGWNSYLEICTSTTGLLYAKIDRQQLTTCKRLQYNCLAGHDDGLSVDFTSASVDILECVKKIKKAKLKFDIILVDPYHEYAFSYRDLEFAFGLLNPNGVLVVHDCIPPSLAMACAKDNGGEWCGLTYKAFIDFVINNSSSLSYYTVNTDYGCGVIKRLAFKEAILNRFISQKKFKIPISIMKKWKKLKEDTETFNFFEQHQTVLLNLKSCKEFQAML